MLNEVFLDYFSRKINPLTKIDARIKIILVFTVLILILCAQVVWIPLSVAGSIIISLFCVKIPLRVVFFRLFIPLSFGAVILFIQTLFYGITPIFRFNFLGTDFTAYSEGLGRGFMIMGKITGATSLIMFLSTTTPFNKLLKALCWLRVPKIWVEVCLLAYRYIFVLLDEAVTVFYAQKTRLGYSTLNLTLRSIGVLTGMVVIRAYEQSISTYEAMILRGYNTEKVIK